MKYSNYTHSRDLAWRVLIDNRISSLPVRLAGICKAYGIHVRSYAQAPHLAKLFSSSSEKNDGFSIWMDEKYILYDDTVPVGRQRFTVAHELGHYLLGHVKPYVPTTYNREPFSDDPLETAANIFASRLLAPACVLWGMGIRASEDISRICDISALAGHVRMERMALLYEREQHFLKTRGRSCFLMSPLERQVHESFADFIEKSKDIKL